MEGKYELQVEIITFLGLKGINGGNKQGFGCVSLCSQETKKAELTDLEDSPFEFKLIM